MDRKLFSAIFQLQQSIDYIDLREEIKLQIEGNLAYKIYLVPTYEKFSILGNTTERLHSIPELGLFPNSRDDSILEFVMPFCLFEPDYSNNYFCVKWAYQIPQLNPLSYEGSVFLYDKIPDFADRFYESADSCVNYFLNNPISERGQKWGTL